MSNKLNTIINHFEKNSFQYFRITENDARIELCNTRGYLKDDFAMLEEIKNITQSLEILKVDYSVDLDGTIILDSV